MNFVIKFFQTGGMVVKWFLLIIAGILAFHLIQPIAIIGLFFLIVGGFFYWTYRFIRFVINSVINFIND